MELSALVIDDNPRLRDAYARNAALLGWKVTVVEGVDQLKRLFEEGRQYHTAIVDWKLWPGTDGGTVAATLRDRAMAENIVIVTAYPGAIDRESMEILGISIHTKPNAISGVLRQLAAVALDDDAQAERRSRLSLDAALQVDQPAPKVVSALAPGWQSIMLLVRVVSILIILAFGGRFVTAVGDAKLTVVDAIVIAFCVALAGLASLPHKPAELLTEVLTLGIRSLSRFARQNGRDDVSKDD